MRYQCDVLVIGAGIVGISTAYYLKLLSPTTSVILIDSGAPMALTSAQSGENYRNWWPHPIMTAFTDRSIDLMEALAIESDNRFDMNRRGYTLSTRSGDIESLMSELVHGYSQAHNNQIRVHSRGSSATYQKPISSAWSDAPSGVDVLQDEALIKETFPSYDASVKTVIHVRRAGAINSQHMGQLMLERVKQAGGVRVTACVLGIESVAGFLVSSDQADLTIKAAKLVNAAGPLINDIAQMLGTKLPVANTLHTAGVIPRRMPFSIDLDAQVIDWSADELNELAASEKYEWLTQEMTGAIHCRPDGGDEGQWVKLGWAFNNSHAVASREPELMGFFPEIVLRGAARLNPSLKTYYGRLPRAMHHYGGFYTLTEENWPLIGEMEVPDSYVVGAMSGFGTMAACAAGDLCARCLLSRELPDFAAALSPRRYSDKALMEELRTLSKRGIL